MSIPDLPAPTRTLWRAFPWDASTSPGERFSASFVPQPTGRGRFDLPRDISPVLYLAETAEHAVAELLQAWRGRRLEAYHLERAGLPLALARVEASAELFDLCDPNALSALTVRSDVTASRLRERTQPVAREVWERGAAGLRWWSTFWGDWHTVVLFTIRTAGSLRFSEPERLTMESAPVGRAAGLLGMRTETAPRALRQGL